MEVWDVFFYDNGVSRLAAIWDAPSFRDRVQLDATGAKSCLADGDDV